MKLKHLVGILLAMQWIVGVSTTGNGPPVSCCSETSKVRVRVDEISSYLHQDKPPCHVKAIRFLLVNGKTICSDPKDAWAKRTMNALNERTTSKALNTPPSWNSRSWTETTTRTSSPGTSTTSTTTMTTPKGTSTTWKSTTYITHRPSTTQKLGNTNKKTQWTTTQITTTKMTTTERKPLTTDITMTSMTMTTESPVTTSTTSTTTMTTPKETSTTWKPTTDITHRASTKQPHGNTNKPDQWTTTQVTTMKMTTTDMNPTDIKTTSMSMITESPVTTTTPKETSTTRMIPTASTKELPGTSSKPGSKTSTMESSTNVTQKKKRCIPLNAVSKVTPGKKIPWTVKRLVKKRKKGLRRAQMNMGCIEG